MFQGQAITATEGRNGGHLPPWHISIQLNWSSHSEDGGSKVLHNRGQFNHYMVQKPKRRPPFDQQQLLNPENLVTCYGLFLAECAACLSGVHCFDSSIAASTCIINWKQHDQYTMWRNLSTTSDQM